MNVLIIRYIFINILKIYIKAKCKEIVLITKTKHKYFK